MWNFRNQLLWVPNNRHGVLLPISRYWKEIRAAWYSPAGIYARLDIARTPPKLWPLILSRWQAGGGTVFGYSRSGYCAYSYYRDCTLDRSRYYIVVKQKTSDPHNEQALQQHFTTSSPTQPIRNALPDRPSMFGGNLSARHGAWHATQADSSVGA
jgi:hypothetical protein